MTSEAENTVEQEAKEPVEPGLILCLQLSEDIVKEVERFVEGSCVVQALSFLDKDNLFSKLPKAAAVICAWDGAAGMAGRSLPELRYKAGDKTPIFVLVRPPHKEEGLDPKKLRYTKTFHWPKDAHKLSCTLYDIAHPDAEAEAARAAAAIEEAMPVDVVLAENVRIKTLKDLKPPPAISEFKLFERVQEEVEKKIKIREDFAKEKNENPNFFIGRILVYHRDPAGGLGLKRHLRSGGFVNVVTESSVSAVLEQLYAEEHLALICWYAEERDETVELIREINEARDIPTPTIGVVCPGETAMNSFTSRGADLLYDELCVFEKKPSLFRANVLETIKKHRDLQSIPRQFMTLKTPWKDVFPKQKRRALSEETFQKHVDFLTTDPSKDYWVISENLLHAILLDDKSRIQDGSRKLLESFPKQLGAIVNCGIAKSILDGAPQAADWLFEQTLNHNKLNLQKSFIISQYLAQWGAAEKLELFLIEWHNREDLAKDHHFDFALSRYYQLVGNMDLHLRYLTKAVVNQPLRQTYLLALLELFETKKDPRKIEQVLRFLLHAAGMNSVKVQLRLAKVLIELSRTSEATKIVDGLLNKSPGLKPALALKAKLAA